VLAAIDVSDVLLVAGAIGSVWLLGWFAVAILQSIVQDAEFRAQVLALLAIGGIAVAIWLLSRAGVIKW
jgi:hypothetical protein